MFANRKLSREDLIIILTNLVPVFGVWFLGWSPTEAFIVYALETVIIGVMTLLKLLVLTIVRKTDDWYNGDTKTKASGFLFMFFFLVHYGMFVAIQTSIFSESANIVPPGRGLLYFFFHWYEYINQDIATMLSVFLISYFIRSFIPFLARGEYKTVSMMRVMFQPYGRIFIQQITVILGSMFLTLGAGKAFILIFVLVKMFFEIRINIDRLIDNSMAAAEKKASDKNPKT